MSIIDEANANAERKLGQHKPIDYARMKREFPKQKAALTRAVNSDDPERVARQCQLAIRTWNEIGAWPDDWSRWQHALDDILAWNRRILLEDLPLLGPGE